MAAIWKIRHGAIHAYGQMETLDLLALHSSWIFMFLG